MNILSIKSSFIPYDKLSNNMFWINSKI